MDTARDIPLGYLLAESLDAVDVHGNKVERASYIACSYQAMDCVTYDPPSPCDDD